MKLKKAFITHQTDRESLLVPTGDAGFAGLMKGNHTLGVILELLKQETDEAQIVAAMQARFDASEEVIACDVHRAITALREIGAIEEG